MIDAFGIYEVLGASTDNMIEHEGRQGYGVVFYPKVEY